MTVADLIVKLQAMLNPEAPVMNAYDEVLDEVCEEDDAVTLSFSNVEDDDEEDEED
jgi:hypothetical protein